MFAPNTDQMHVVNHCEGKPAEGKRNVLQESARIARGDVTDLAKLDLKDFDALIIPGAIVSRVRPYTGPFLTERHCSIRRILPLFMDRFVIDLFCLQLCAISPFLPSGGFGVAKNLSDWAVKGKDFTVQPQVEKVIKAFRQAGKPLGMCCISPVLAAKALPGCEITVGQDKECEKYAVFVFHPQTCMLTVLPINAPINVCYYQSMFRSMYAITNPFSDQAIGLLLQNCTKGEK